MRQLTGITIAFALLFILSLCPAEAAPRKEYKKEYKKDFPAVDKVSLKLFSGSCRIIKSDSNRVTVHVSHESPDSSFEPKITREDDILMIRERRKMEVDDAQWTISVPAKTDIKASLVIHDISIEGIEGDIYAKSVSGDVSARDCRGTIKLGSVSGSVSAEKLKGSCRIKAMHGSVELIDIKGEIYVSLTAGDVTAVGLSGETVIKANSGVLRLKESDGGFHIKNAAGDIDAVDLTITDDSSFKVVSGNIAIGLAKTPNVDIKLATTSGDAVLNYNGHPLKGTFHLKVMSRVGAILAPYEFDKVDIHQEKWGKKYRTKTFSKGGDSPDIHIIASTGNAVLKEK